MTEKYKPEVLLFLKKLHEVGLVEKKKNNYRLCEKIDTFIVLTKNLISARQYKEFMPSNYFASMLEMHLVEIISKRQHSKMNDIDLNVLKMMIKASHRTASFVIFGDTTKFDNLAEQLRVQEFSEKQREEALRFNGQFVMQQVAMSFANDMLEAKLLNKIDNKQLAGIVLRIVFSDMAQ